MTLSTPRSRPACVIAAALTALAFVAGCNDINTAKDDRTGRGSGDQLPAQGNAAQGTNATTSEITVEGPGSEVLAKSKNPNPSASVPYGGSGAGVSPPVTPAQGGAPSGDSNSGRRTGSQAGVGSDATTENAKPGAGATGPGTGTPPR